MDMESRTDEINTELAEIRKRLQEQAALMDAIIADNQRMVERMRELQDEIINRAGTTPDSE